MLINTERVPYIVQLLFANEKSDKLRQILDLWHVNMHVYKQKRKLEDWDDMLNYVENECFMYNFDIKQSFNYIDIEPEHKIYLGFAEK